MSRLLTTGINAGGAEQVRVVGGEGAWFVLDDGRRVIDLSNTGCPLGHGHPSMIDAVRSAAAHPVVSEGWLWVDREAAAQELVGTAFAGEDWVGAVRFCLSGSEANDLALSLAQCLTRRSAIATRERAYHGMVGFARDVTVQPHWHGGLSDTAGIRGAVPRGTKVCRVPGPGGSRFGDDGSPGGAAVLADAERVLAECAAVVVDYTQGGTYHDPAYQDRLAEAARAAGALWIADEVVTGFHRTGPWFGFQRAASRPDIVTLGKPLAGGAAAAGAVVVSRSVVEALAGASWQTYSTFRGHPITMAAVRAHLQVQATEDFERRVSELEDVFARSFADIAERHVAVRRVDGRGAHWTVELHGEGDWRAWTGLSAELPVASRVAARALELGAAIGTSGERDSLFLAPPLIITPAELREALDALDAALDVADEDVT